jgi:3-hydroxyacyl-CoA dehydrogenase
MTQCIRYEIEGDGIAILTIEMNVVTEELIDRLDELVTRVACDDALRGAIVTSGKPTFLEGFDLMMIQKRTVAARTAPVDSVFQQVLRVSRLFRRLETCGKPFAAAINGLAIGGGLELALACHYRVVADDPTIQLGLPQVKFGLLPGAGGTQRLPRLTGIEPALPLLLHGESISPQQAGVLGIVHKLVPREKLLSEAKRSLLEEGDPVQPWDKKGYRIPGGAAVLTAKVAQVFIVGNALLQKETLHNYPAAIAIMSCVYEGTQVSLDAALPIEDRYFTSVLRDPVAGNMIRTLFINKRAADKLIKRPKRVPASEVKILGILGAGIMGAGIAYVSAMAGMEVILLDRELERADAGKAYARGLLDKQVKRGELTPGDHKAILNRIRPTIDYADFKPCELVIEAVFEDRTLKAQVIQKTEAVISESSLLASNTSTLPITDLASVSKRAERFIGIHFFSPVNKMPLVEIIRGKNTTEETLAKALDYVRKIKKTPIVVNDSRGFYTSRCFATYVNEGMTMVAEGILPALIENAGRLCGMPLGPLAVSDEVSLQLLYDIKEANRKALGEAYLPSPSDHVLDYFVNTLGRLGKKNGKGFYSYPEQANKHLWLGLKEHFPSAKEQPDIDELKKRFLYRQAVEAARCLQENVLTDPADADIGAVLGWGFAPYTGGPLALIDTLGVKAFVQELERLAKQYGARFAPPKMLCDMAKRSGTFY